MTGKGKKTQMNLSYKMIAPSVSQPSATSRRRLRDGNNTDVVPYPTEGVFMEGFHKKLVGFIVKDMQPIQIVENGGFKDMMYYLDPRVTLPSRTTKANTLIPREFKSAKAALFLELQSVTYVSLTTDCWPSRRMEPLMTVTVHSIVNGQLESRVLVTCPTIGSHTANNLSSKLETIASEWGITEKVVCVITDNASNIVAAINLLTLQTTVNDRSRQGLMLPSLTCPPPHSPPFTPKANFRISTLLLFFSAVVEDGGRSSNELFPLISLMLEGFTNVFDDNPVRFKSMYHMDVSRVEKQLKNLLYGSSHGEGDKPSTSSTINPRSLWAAHGHRVERINETSSRPSSNSRANAINLIREYTLYPRIAKHENSLQCYISSFRARFSHASDLISAKRSRLSGSTLNELYPLGFFTHEEFSTHEECIPLLGKEVEECGK
ncbi:Uncharacterized protein APZ42_020380 [Daphnia magna]|uniref:DUF659 domain-containing protein n=1 Tax=Daphnia magna TaxID=35525 RepID=A0A164XJ84_9CRUS|nr:Uncharacterized protein APZ42_020380 [Daphnia magna]